MLGRRRLARVVAAVVAAACVVGGAVVATQASAATVVTNPGSVSVAFAGSLSLNGATPITINGINGTGTGTVDASGNVSLLNAGLSFSPFSILVANVIPANVSIQPLGDWTGTIDPDAGTLNITGSLTAHLDDSAAAQSVLGSDCPVGPLALNLTTGTTGLTHGTPYNAGTGVAEIVDNNFTIPASPDPNPTCPGVNLINSGAPLPLGPPKATIDLTATFTPAPQGSGTPPTSSTTTTGSSTTTTGSSTTTTTGSTTTTTTTPSGPTVSVADTSVIEPIIGSTKMAFTVTLSEPSAVKTSVRYETSDGTATAGLDYSHRRGTAKFAPGVTSKVVYVTVKHDSIPEPDETVFLDLSFPKNVTIARGHAVGTIIDKGPVGISVSDASVTEPDRGSVNMKFTISLTKASTSSVKVSFATADLTATAPADYTAKSGSVSIRAGHTSVVVTVSVKGDTIVEGNEIFLLTLSHPIGGLIVDGIGAGTIIDND
jgi:chitinase